MKTTLIISPNDLEATEILTLAQESGAFQCVRLTSSAKDGECPLAWGERLDPAHPDLNSDVLGPAVVIVEAPAPAFEEHLRATGRIVEVIDHHLYIDRRNSILDRRCARSSLEQFVSLFGMKPLSTRQRLVTANDRGGWPAMIASAQNDLTGEQRPEGVHSYLFGEIWDVRRADLGCRIKNTDIDGLLNDAITFLQTAEAAGKLRILSCGRGNVNHPELILVRAPDAFKTILVDALYYAHFCPSPRAAIPHRPSVQRWGNHEPLNDRPLELLIAYEDENGRISQVEYSGPALRRSLLDQLIDELAQKSRLSVWAGGGDLACYFGAVVGEASHKELSELGDQLVNAVLAGNRPLIRWRTQCLQLLRYDPEDVQPSISDTTRAVHQGAAVGTPVRNYVLDYMQPFFTPRSEATKGSTSRGACMRSVNNPGPIDPWSLTIHSYRWRDRETLPGFRVEWPDGTKDERPLSDIAVHFLYGGLIALEWTFQDGWPEHVTAAEAAGGSLFDELLLTPVLVRDGGGRKREVSPPPASDRTAFPVWTDKGYDDRQEYPTLAFDTRHVEGIECLAALLDFNDAARQCYSAFYSPSARKTLSLLLPCRSSGSDRGWSPRSTLEFGAVTQGDTKFPVGWFADLVRLSVGEPFGIAEGQLRLVLDERARVITSAACVGGRPTLPTALDQWEVMFSRLATVEPFEPQHFYDREFSRVEIAKARYDRFRTQELYPDSSQLFAVTDHSLAFLGHGWFAAAVTIKHVACQYHRLFLIAQLYTSVFHSFVHKLGEISRSRSQLDNDIDHLSREIEAAVERGATVVAAHRQRAELWRLLDRKAEDIHRIKSRFIAFANGLRFEDVSTQIQGRELFALMTRQLRVETHYQQVESKIARSEAQDSEDMRRRHEWRVTEWTTLGSFVATLVTVATIASPFASGIDAIGSIIVFLSLVLAAAMPMTLLVVTRGYSVRRARAEVCASAAMLLFTTSRAVRTICRYAGSLVCHGIRRDRCVTQRECHLGQPANHFSCGDDKQ